MNTQIIDSELDRLYNQSLNNPQIISSYFLDEDKNLSVRVDTYTSIEGNGFRVIGFLKENNKTYIKVLNHGPDINSNMEWQELYIPSTGAN